MVQLVWFLWVAWIRRQLFHCNYQVPETMNHGLPSDSLWRNWELPTYTLRWNEEVMSSFWLTQHCNCTYIDKYVAVELCNLRALQDPACFMTVKHPHQKLSILYIKTTEYKYSFCFLTTSLVQWLCCHKCGRSRVCFRLDQFRNKLF